MRTWKPAPKVGASVSRLSRKYFFTMAILAMVIVGSYIWTGFPFDNLCEPNNNIGNFLHGGNWTISPLGDDINKTEVVFLEDSDSSLHYCNQNLMTQGVFPALPRFQPKGNEWMTKEQETLTKIYGWTSVAVLFGVVVIFSSQFVQYFKNMFRSTYVASGDDQSINFSDVPSISAYIPQVNSTMFPYPLIAADIDGLDEELFDWNDSDHPFSFYDLTRDTEELLQRYPINKDSSKHVFTRIRHWPPLVAEEVRPPS